MPAETVLRAVPGDRLSYDSIPRHGEGSPTPTLNLSPGIGPHEFDRQAAVTIGHLQHGDRVVVEVRLRRADPAQQEVAAKLLDRIAFLADGVGSVEYRENVDARTVRMLLVPGGPTPEALAVAH